MVNGGPNSGIVLYYHTVRVILRWCDCNRLFCLFQSNTAGYEHAQASNFLLPQEESEEGRVLFGLDQVDGQQRELYSIKRNSFQSNDSIKR